MRESWDDSCSSCSRTTGQIPTISAALILRMPSMHVLIWDAHLATVSLMDLS